MINNIVTKQENLRQQLYCYCKSGPAVRLLLRAIYTIQIYTVCTGLDLPYLGLKLLLY